MSNPLYSLCSELDKVKKVIKNKNTLLGQLDAKIEKAILNRDKAKASLPIYQRQLDTGLARAKVLYQEHKVSLERDILIADNPEKKERAINHLKQIRDVLGIPPE